MNGTASSDVSMLDIDASSQNELMLEGLGYEHRAGLEAESPDGLRGTVSQQMPESLRKSDWLSVGETISTR